MGWRTRIAAGLVLLGASPPVFAADIVVTMAQLARDPAAYAGKRVVLSDCFMIGSNPFSGAQCSVNPIDSAQLVYIDSDTWTPQAHHLIDDCTTAIIEQMCTIKVTGDVTINRRGQALILNALIEIVSRPSQAI